MAYIESIFLTAALWLSVGAGVAFLACLPIKKKPLLIAAEALTLLYIISLTISLTARGMQSGHAPMSNRYESVLAGRHFSGEYRFCTPAGETRWVYGSATALRDSVSEIIGYLGVVGFTPKSVELPTTGMPGRIAWTVSTRCWTTRAVCVVRQRMNSRHAVLFQSRAAGISLPVASP